ncbi:hypothetical protein TERTU_2764 [Teredinibacter turnerae T7901]|uniref:Uncharacterized protein n=1 Tax=Teredinibacter turnerae (strain ATCC 39867 / T7901) TaxID=377629 RepID=C5BML1_TERTT|nr:hypothetical protein TERTU_2764 [Teredinibacter turnerae T7901]
MSCIFVVVRHGRYSSYCDYVFGFGAAWSNTEGKQRIAQVARLAFYF